jgi:3-hydroxyisobutyrate dehydrogenase-like beta-hydroxyacid dehydrogenase
MKIGIAGTGRMGTAIALRLLDKGHEVTVWNRTRDKVPRGGSRMSGKRRPREGGAAGDRRRPEAYRYQELT